MKKFLEKTAHEKHFYNITEGKKLCRAKKMFQ